MILIITHKEDYTADYLVNILNNRRIDYFRFNCEDCLQEDITLRFGRDASPNYPLLNGKKANAVWYRRTKLPEIKANNDEERLYLLKEVDAFLYNLLGIIPGKWLSHPVAVREAESKFLQLRIASDLGLQVPETIVSTNKEEIISFYNNHERIIVKPLNTGRIDYSDGSSKLIFSNIVTKEKIEMLGTLELTPAIFQQYIENDYELRITIVGDQVFAAKVMSQSDEAAAIDWRRKQLQFSASELPDEIAEKCKLMMKQLGVAFGAFDFIKTKQDQYYFLEVNPNGQWVWIENDTGLKISEAIINYLLC